MQTATKTCLLLISAIGLAGCDGPAEPFAFATTYDTFDDIETAFEASTLALVDEDGALAVDTDAISQSASFAAVSSGTTTYTGAIIAKEENIPENPDDGRTLIGQLQLDVAFDTNTMNAYAGNFIFNNDDALTGTLTGNGGFVRESVEDPVDSGFFDPHFTDTDMTLTGGLSGPNGETYNANIGLTGYFLDIGGDVGSIAGVADVDFGDPDVVFVEGAFAVTD
jgi:hypothetical protein